MIPLADIVRRYGDRPLFITADGTVSYKAFETMVAREADSLPAAVVIRHELAWSAASFARLLALFERRRSVFLGTDTSESAHADAFLAAAPLLILRTGGTTGAPRHVVHALDTCLSPYAVLDRPPVRLLVLYAAGHIAGLDAFLQALHRGSTLVVPRDTTPVAVAQAIEAHRVQVLPATPTFLQFLLLSGELEARDLTSVETIPHGAEPMPAPLRARLQGVFPKAQLLQRFGMTELGALPVRPDPADPAALYLEGTGYVWKVVDGELWIRSPLRMLGTLEDGPVDPADPWHRTGDLAELTPAGAVRILGRREAMINVGGFKVLPETVEALLLQQDGVLDAAVFGMPNPLTGQAVAARVVFAGEPDPLNLLRALRIAARTNNLSLAHVPTRIEPVARLDKTALGKRARPPLKA